MCYIAHGFVSGHPELEDGTHIDTSIVERINLERRKRRLVVYTHSKHWSDGLEAIQIENAGSTDILFFSGDNLLCKAGEVTLIENTQFRGEGLFSPDVVNGKSVFFDGEEAGK